VRLRRYFAVALAHVLLVTVAPAQAGVLFDSSSDRLTASTFTVPTTGTMCFNIYPNWAQTDGALHIFADTRTYAANGDLFAVSKENAANSNVLSVGWIDAYVDYRIHTTSYTLNQNAWNVICLTWDDVSNETKAYLNGPQLGSTGSSLVTWDTSAQTLTLGNGSNSEGLAVNMDGRLAEVGFWNRVLTSTELSNRMGGQLSNCMSSGLVNYWPLNSTSNLNDQAGSENLTNSGVTDAADHPSTTACGGGVNFPTVPAVDDFNRANAALTGSLSWVAWPLLAGSADIISNVVGAGVNGEGNLWGVSHGPDVEVFYTITTVGGTSLTWRHSTTTSTDTRYFIDINIVGGSNNDTIGFGKAIAGSYTSDIGGVINLGLDIQANDRVGIRMIGNSVAIFHCRPAGTCTEVGTRTDSSITDAGYSGIYLADTTVRVDDFGSGTFVPAGQGGACVIGGGMSCRGIID
jgi:hypothetical protein